MSYKLFCNRIDLDNLIKSVKSWFLINHELPLYDHCDELPLYDHCDELPLWLCHDEWSISSHRHIWNYYQVVIGKSILNYSTCGFCMYCVIIISLNEVFGDIMVLASPPPRPPPVDPDNVNTLNSKNIQWISFKVYMRVDTPLRYVAIEIWYPPRTRTTAPRSQTTLVSPKYSKCNISISNGLIAFKFYTEVKNLKLHKKIVND